MLTIYLILYFSLRKNINRRWDGSPALPYYSPKDLGILESRFSFYSGKWLLSGSRYFLNKGPYKGLVVFFHGLGAGRTSYLMEISSLVKAGYLVYAYDNTGSMESQGPTIIGLAQTIKDMRHFFAFLDADPLSKGLRRYAMGHSWGGYGAMMSLNNDYHIKRAISISGFVQPSIEYGFLAKPLANPFLKPFVKLILKQMCGKDGDASAIPVIKKSQGKLLYIQGTNDKLVGFSSAYGLLKKNFQNDPKVTLIEAKGAEHAAFLSDDAQKYQDEMNAKGLTSLTGPIGLKMDIRKATGENPEIMKAIFEFLAK
jgi:uncharacterized protein